MATPNLSLLDPSEKQYPVRSGPLTYPAHAIRYHSPVPGGPEQETSTLRRIQRKVQLLAAFLALLLSAMAFASIIHPSYHVASSTTNGLDRHHGLFDTLSVGFGDHGVRAPAQVAPEKPSPQSQKKTVRSAYTRDRWFKRGAWKMPRGRTAAAESTASPESTASSSTSLEPTQSEALLPAATAAQKVNLADVQMKSTRAVQAQLMEEARARLTKQRKERLAERLGGRV